jgi:sensor domain CHASE-containing protein
MEEKISPKLDTETVNEIKSTIIQLRAIWDVIDAQHILMNEYRWRLLCRNLVTISDMFQKIIEHCEEIKDLIIDIIDELKSKCEP